MKLMLEFVSLSLKCLSLGLVIAAGAFWAGAEVSSRPKHRDEQTLVGGAVWTQTIIPIGLIISTMIDDQLSFFVRAYFLIAGFLLLVITGLVLDMSGLNGGYKLLFEINVIIIGEYKSMHRQRQAIPTLPRPLEALEATPTYEYDKIYFGIGTLSLLAGIFTLADFIVNIFTSSSL